MYFSIAHDRGLAAICNVTIQRDSHLTILSMT